MTDHTNLLQFLREYGFPNSSARRKGEAAADLIESQDAQIAALTAELERERMRLAACGVAADQNTERTRELHRLPVDSEYRSGSYDSVCAAVDREIALRAENEALRKALAELVAVRVLEQG